METKKCSKCGIEKELCEFHKHTASKYGVRSVCKICLNKESREYSKNNRDIRNKIQQNWRNENKEKVKEYRKKYYDKDPQKFILMSKNYRINNKEKVKDGLKKYYLKNLNYHKNRMKLWVEKNKEHRKEYQKNWKIINKEFIIKYKKERYDSDLLYKLIISARNRINSFLKNKNITKKNRTFDIVGCNPKELKEHLEKQFVDGMCWENRNEWHIDHIVPLSSAKTEDEVYGLCHYTNLQPLWAKDNLQKSNKLLKN
jgi:hypothetical protein